jgi:hypothetical protein
MMGKYLDLDDAAAGNPVAERELAEMRERMAALETALAKAADMLEIYAVKVDGEWGDCRDAGQLYADGEMPEALTEARALLTQEEGG